MAEWFAKDYLRNINPEKQWQQPPEKLYEWKPNKKSQENYD